MYVRSHTGALIILYVVFQPNESVDFILKIHICLKYNKIIRNFTLKTQSATLKPKKGCLGMQWYQASRAAERVHGATQTF
jgi:hypothetical protein